MTARRRRRRKQLLEYLKEKKGYWKLKESAVDGTIWRTFFGRGMWTCCKADCGVDGWMTSLFGITSNQHLTPHIALNHLKPVYLSIRHTRVRPVHISISNSQNLKIFHIYRNHDETFQARSHLPLPNSRKVHLSTYCRPLWWTAS